MEDLEEHLAALRIVPVVVLEDADDALPLCDALKSGGLPLAEVTFRTDAAIESIARIGRERPTMLVGAGTILTSQQVGQAVEAGASFIVTPGFNPEVVNAALQHRIPIIPGVNNPSQVEAAMAFGPRLLKFFPAEASGGRAMLKALSGPYQDVRFVPTGGIGPGNLADYLSLDNVIACGGSWMVTREMIKDKDYDSVVQLTQQAMELVQSHTDVPNT